MEEAKQKDLITKIFNYIKEKLNEYLNGMDDFEKLQEFMSNEGNLYDSDGKPTEEYKEWMTKVESYCTENPIEIATTELDQDKIEVLKGAKDFLVKQKDLMTSLREASDKEAWFNSELRSDEKREAFNKLVEESTNNALNNA